MFLRKFLIFVTTSFLFAVPSAIFAQPPTVQLPKTGQQTVYTPNDDGALQIGVAWPAPRFTNNSDGTVTDNLTGLIWLRNGNCANTTVKWDTVFTYVAELNSSGTMNANNCGDTSNGGSHQTDWRVPNVNELESLLDLEQAIVAAWLNTQGFINIPGDPPIGDYSERYWSSTTFAGDNTHAWTVQITEARVRHEEKTAVDRYVWAVRGGE